MNWNFSHEEFRMAEKSAPFATPERIEPSLCRVRAAQAPPIYSNRNVYDLNYWNKLVPIFWIEILSLPAIVDRRGFQCTNWLESNWKHTRTRIVFNWFSLCSTDRRQPRDTYFNCSFIVCVPSCLLVFSEYDFLLVFSNCFLLLFSSIFFDTNDASKCRVSLFLNNHTTKLYAFDSVLKFPLKCVAFFFCSTNIVCRPHNISSAATTLSFRRVSTCGTRFVHIFSNFFFVRFFFRWVFCVVLVGFVNR